MSTSILPSTAAPTTYSPQTEVPTTISPQTEVPTTILPQPEEPHTAQTQSPSGKPEYTNGPVHPTIKPLTTNKPVEVTPSHPVYNETDVVYPGLVEISPNIFHCMDPEFYFAPHPRNCEMYFICENYRIHPHECGEGVYWDYMNNRCNFPLAAICYGNPSNNFGKMVCSSSGHTFEYKEDECKYVADSSPVKPGNDISNTNIFVVEIEFFFCEFITKFQAVLIHKHSFHMKTIVENIISV